MIVDARSEGWQRRAAAFERDERLHCHCLCPGHVGDSLGIMQAPMHDPPRQIESFPRNASPTVATICSAMSTTAFASPTVTSGRSAGYRASTAHCWSR